MSEDARAHVVISGRVQMVNFRWETQRMALRLGLCGWVRNRADGTVEAVFEGTQETVQEALRWCERGSPRAIVDRVTVNWEAPRGQTRQFDIHLD